MNSLYEIVPSLEGYDKDVNGYYCLLYVKQKSSQKDIYVQCSISKMEDTEMMDYAVGFLSTHALNNINQPYIPEPFNEIEDAAWKVFVDAFEKNKNVRVM